MFSKIIPIFADNDKTSDNSNPFLVVYIQRKIYALILFLLYVMQEKRIAYHIPSPHSFGLNNQPVQPF